MVLLSEDPAEAMQNFNLLLKMKDREEKEASKDAVFAPMCWDTSGGEGDWLTRGAAYYPCKLNFELAARPTVVGCRHPCG